MTATGLLQLAAATAIFFGAGLFAKIYADDPSAWKAGASLILYALGNLIMLRLIRDFGMSTAFSLSSVIQLVALNVVAFAYFGERVGLVQGAGIVLAIVSVAMITLGPSASR